MQKFITNQDNVNAQITRILQNHDAQVRDQPDTPILTNSRETSQARGLTVQLPVFYGKQNENVITWLLQVDLLFKARKIEAKEQLQ